MIERSWSSAALADVARVVRERTGLVFPDSRREVAEGTIRRSMARLGLSDLARYARLLEEEGPALDDLVSELTVGETYFFREAAQLEYIRDTIVPDILLRRGDRHVIRVWSAGSASGEEPYSLAILFHQMGLADRVRILATEISRPRLAAARQGRYGRWSMRGVPQDVVGRWFAQRDSRYQLDPAISRMVDFRYLNLASDSYPASSTGVWGMDLILCRNVLIYFDADTVARVAQRLLGSLAEGGWLVLGASDPMLADVVRCEVVMTGAGLAYRRWGAPSLAVEQGERAAEIAATPLELIASAFAPPPEERPPSAKPIREETLSAYAARDYARAAELALAVVTDAPDDAAAWVLRVRALANSGRLEEAGSACRDGLERHPASAELAYLQSLLLAEHGRLAEAGAAARRALYLDRSLVVAHIALGSALSRMGDTVGARRAFANAEELLERMPPREVVPASDGESAFRLREIVRAQGALLRGDAA
jgi:chemotaxis protein methyltransferase CheR